MFSYYRFFINELNFKINDSKFVLYHHIICIAITTTVIFYGRECIIKVQAHVQKEKKRKVYLL